MMDYHPHPVSSTGQALASPLKGEVLSDKVSQMVVTTSYLKSEETLGP